MCRTKEDVEDVRREVQIMHHLKGHENIVTLIGAFEDKQSVHLVRAPLIPPSSQKTLTFQHDAYCTC